MISVKKRLSLASLILIFSSFGMLGCGSRAVFVQPGTVAVTTGWVKKVPLAAPDAKGNLVPSSADLPPGTMVKVPAQQEKPEK